MTDATQVTDVIAHLGESPVWTSDDATIRWLDISLRRLHAFDTQTNRVMSIKLSATITAIAPASRSHLIGACRGGFAFVDLASATIRRVGPRLVEHPGDRMNDGACDPQGRFWAGSMVSPARAGSGALWMLDRELRVATILRGVTVSNGLGWSPDGTTAYYVDTWARRIDAVELGADGRSVATRAPLVKIGPDDWLPDGLAVDAAGYIWVAIWGGERIQRYAPDGRLDCEVGLAARNVTSCAFGGPQLTEIYITSAREGLAQRELDLRPTNGGLFRAAAPVAGSPVSAFRGAPPPGE